MTASARMAARKGIVHARIWAAPRLERTGHTLEDQVAPKMAAMLSAAAQRIEPVPARRRRRWPVLAAGLVAAAGLSATAAYLLKRRAAAHAPKFSAPADARQHDHADRGAEPPGRERRQRARPHRLTGGRAARPGPRSPDRGRAA